MSATADERTAIFAPLQTRLGAGGLLVRAPVNQRGAVQRHRGPQVSQEVGGPPAGPELRGLGTQGLCGNGDNVTLTVTAGGPDNRGLHKERAGGPLTRPLAVGRHVETKRLLTGGSASHSVNNVVPM